MEEIEKKPSGGAYEAEPGSASGPPKGGSASAKTLDVSRASDYVMRKRESALRELAK
ncbi:hypothetical protein NPA31_018935 [Aurantimonas sp. MSK8Z-1]|uniref:hypothetical protein n=1 Tax=Mangrovibrevibacter kandeliae TaxID=2968473 RepID=UPI0021197E8A|nr:hypothetical protein [Aurantimonas sp. MSK8Z-1]MCW4117040.1 hypothetical protein [Aurantimonas sp. MSK8Z-1]